MGGQNDRKGVGRGASSELQIQRGACKARFSFLVQVRRTLVGGPVARF